MLDLRPIQPEIGNLPAYLPNLEDDRQDLLSDTFKRLNYLAEIKNDTKFPFTVSQIKVLKMSRQAETNAQICLDWGFIPLCLIATASSIGSCLPLTGLSAAGQALVAYPTSCIGSFLNAQLGLMWGGRNTNVGSDQYNRRQNILHIIIRQYDVLAKDLIYLFKNNETKEQTVQLAQSISINNLYNSAYAATLSEEEANRIFKLFEGALNKVCGRSWRNADIENLMK